MEITGTREAFEALISERGVYDRLGVSISTVATWKIYLRQGKSISLDKMEEMLLKSGAKVKREKEWVVRADNEFTKSEIDKIRALIIEIRSSGKNHQIALRGKLRDELNFNIRKYRTDQRGYTSDDLDHDIESGKIIVID